MAIHNDIGRDGELEAIKFLLQNGYEILDQNWVAGKAEVDIIAYKLNTIIFIEVKTRSSLAFGKPEEFVSTEKQRLLTNAAQTYIEVMEFEGEIRFDIISVILTKEKRFNINHIEDAFWFYE